MYKDMNTGEVFTLEEVKDLFEQYRWELKRHYDTFDEYMDDMKKKGNLKEVDKDWIEENLAGELSEMIAFGWTDEEAKADKDAFFERIGHYANGLTEEEVWEVWQNVVDIHEEELELLGLKTEADQD